MKIFFNENLKGTLIDSVSKTAGTLTAGNGGFKRTEKGQAMLFDGKRHILIRTEAMPFLNLTGDITVILWVKPLLDNITQKGFFQQEQLL